MCYDDATKCSHCVIEFIGVVPEHLTGFLYTTEVKVHLIVPTNKQSVSINRI